MIINPVVLAVAITHYAANRLTRQYDWDRSPLTEKARRFYGLREVVGYQSWIDQDGYPVVGA